MKKYEIINEVIKNGYYLIEATEFGELVFNKIVGCGDLEIHTRIEICNIDELKAEFRTVSIFRTLHKSGEKAVTVQEFYTTFDEIEIDGKAVTNRFNYTSIVL